LGKGCSEKCRSAMPRSAIVSVASQTHQGSSYTGAADVEDDAVGATIVSPVYAVVVKILRQQKKLRVLPDSTLYASGKGDTMQAARLTRGNAHQPHAPQKAAPSPLPLPTPTNHHLHDTQPIFFDRRAPVAPCLLS
jgi:hypothetical protein